MEPINNSSKKFSWNHPHAVLIPFYCACILLLGANLFQDRCCQEVQQQIQAIDPHGLQEMNTRLSQIQRRLEHLDEGPAIQISAPISPSLPGAESGELVAEFGLDLLTNFIVDRISSFLDDKEQVPVVTQEVKNQIVNYFHAGLNRKNSGELPIYFDTDRATVPASGRQLIESFRGFVRKHPEQRITIAGFADRVGHPAYNRQLAMRRSKAVAALMEGLPAQIEIETIEGEDHLPVFTADEVSEPRNRMVVIRWKAGPHGPGGRPGRPTLTRARP